MKVVTAPTLDILLGSKSQASASGKNFSFNIDPNVTTGTVTKTFNLCNQNILVDLVVIVNMHKATPTITLKIDGTIAHNKMLQFGYKISGSTKVVIDATGPVKNNK